MNWRRLSEYGYNAELNSALRDAVRYRLSRMQETIGDKSYWEREAWMACFVVEEAETRKQRSLLGRAKRQARRAGSPEATKGWR